MMCDASTVVVSNNIDALIEHLKKGAVHMFYRKKDVAVAGGGNTALEDALYLANIARRVYLIHRRDTFRGEEATVERLRARDNVTFVLQSRVTKLNAGKRLESIVTEDSEGNTRTLDVSGMFVAVGRVPENQPFSDLIELDSAGYAVAGEDCRTRTAGIFVAGDNRTKSVRQLVTATADGATAATAVAAGRLLQTSRKE